MSTLTLTAASVENIVGELCCGPPQCLALMRPLRGLLHLLSLNDAV